MATAEERERGGMPLWAVLAALVCASLSCVAFLARFALVFAEDLRWLDCCLEWGSYGAFAAAAALPVVGLLLARNKRGT
jgi:hypothetical protein